MPSLVTPPHGAPPPAEAVFEELFDWFDALNLAVVPTATFSSELALTLQEVTFFASFKAGDERVQKLLILARHKLRSAQAPTLLKILSYLRLCCLAIQRTCLGEPSCPASNNLYLRLLQALMNSEPTWWNHCHISNSGHLSCTSPQLEPLIQPIEAFVQYSLQQSSSHN